MKIDNALINSSPEEMESVVPQYKTYIPMAPINTVVSTIAVQHLFL